MDGDYAWSPTPEPSSPGARPRRRFLQVRKKPIVSSACVLISNITAIIIIIINHFLILCAGAQQLRSLHENASST